VCKQSSVAFFSLAFQTGVLYLKMLCDSTSNAIGLVFVDPSGKCETDKKRFGNRWFVEGKEVKCGKLGNLKIAVSSA
jgi:hypothetical protein